jgi:hypothetical protein
MLHLMLLIIWANQIEGEDEAISWLNIETATHLVSWHLIQELNKFTGSC